MCGSRCLGPMTFHADMTGDYVTISQGGRLASRDASSFMNGLAFLSRAVKVDEKMCIRIERCSSGWDGTLRIGFTNVRPNKHSIPPSSIPELRDTPGFCVLPVPADLCVHNAMIHFWINYAGMVLVEGMTRERYYIKAKGLNLNNQLWVFIDLYGNTSTVRLLGKCATGELLELRIEVWKNVSVTCTGSRRGSRTSCPDDASGINWNQLSEKNPDYTGHDLLGIAHKAGKNGSLDFIHSSKAFLILLINRNQKSTEDIMVTESLPPTARRSEDRPQPRRTIWTRTNRLRYISHPKIEYVN